MTENFRQAFQEEAREVLLELESALLALHAGDTDPELVGRAFRALHTLKGSGAMFGFDELAEFTHHVENLFEEVRSGRRKISPELIQLTLESADEIKRMLDDESGGTKSNAAARNRVLEKLKELTGTQAGQCTKPDEKPASQVAVKQGSEREYEIRFYPGAELLRAGANPLLLFRELSELGTLMIEADLAKVPALADLEPERCYIGWKLSLRTAAKVETVRDVFIFVEDNCELDIQQVADLGKVPPITDRATAGRREADKAEGSSVRVKAAKIDQLIDLVGQLVTVQARLVEIAARREDRDLQVMAEDVEALTAALRDTSMGMRTLPLRSTFERFKRLVYELGRSLHKEVALSFEGAETELDKSVIDQLSDPLMHLIRNSMDHGIETPDMRRSAGKNSSGRIHLAARHAGAQVLISVEDDGRGIDADTVRAKAIERALIHADARLNDSEVLALILTPGFSTASEVTDISGRGVGMDVVRKNIEGLRGTVEISSCRGLGTKVTLRLPLTLAIIDGLLVQVGESRFVMPLGNTVECVELTRQEVEKSEGKRLAVIRGEMVPYIRLSEFLHIHRRQQEREQVMVAETEHGRFGFVVDQVLGDHQTVIKNLGRLYRNVEGVSGATILGDGSVALILDLNRLAHHAIREQAMPQTACRRFAVG